MVRQIYSMVAILTAEGAEKTQSSTEPCKSIVCAVSLRNSSNIKKANLCVLCG